VSDVFECVINVSASKDLATLEALTKCAGPSLRDVHTDVDHNRSVFTLINDLDPLRRDVRAFLQSVFTLLTLQGHEGVHPRFGVADVIPFVALNPRDQEMAVALRNETAKWLADEFAVPTFLYGPVGGELRTLPFVRKHAFGDLVPDFGPTSPHALYGASAVGERPVMLAWNIWLKNTTLARARELCALARRPEVRTMAFAVGDEVQVSCNIIALPGSGAMTNARPSEVYDLVSRALVQGETISRAELVGLAPQAVLDAEDPTRWPELGLSRAQTIEAKLAIN
jgi:glutamate formiminotransferase